MRKTPLFTKPKVTHEPLEQILSQKEKDIKRREELEQDDFEIYLQKKKEKDMMDLYYSDEEDDSSEEEYDDESDDEDEEEDEEFTEIKEEDSALEVSKDDKFKKSDKSVNKKSASSKITNNKSINKSNADKNKKVQIENLKEIKYPEVPKNKLNSTNDKIFNNFDLKQQEVKNFSSNKEYYSFVYNNDVINF
jgi:hypothetical protein